MLKFDLRVWNPVGEFPWNFSRVPAYGLGEEGEHGSSQYWSDILYIMCFVTLGGEELGSLYPVDCEHGGVVGGHPSSLFICCLV